MEEFLLKFLGLVETKGETDLVDDPGTDDFKGVLFYLVDLYLELVFSALDVFANALKHMVLGISVELLSAVNLGISSDN